MPQLIRFITLPLACSLLWACAAPETKSPVETPGRPESAKTQLLEAGAATLHAKPPVEAINA
jgi:outer membrane biogenesis lipoprotein LolB